MAIPSENSQHRNKIPRCNPTEESTTRIVHTQPPIRRIFAQGCPIYRETKAPCEASSRCYTRMGTGTIIHDNTELYLLMPLKLLAEKTQNFVVMHNRSPFAWFAYQLPLIRNKEAESKNLGLIELKIGEVSIEKKKKEERLSVIIKPGYPLPAEIRIHLHHNYSTTDNCFF